MYLYFRRAGTVEKKVVGLLRSIVYLLIIFALAVPQLLLPVKTETVVFLADRSKSVEKSEEEILDWISEAVKGKKAEQKYAIASFANGTQMEGSLSGSGNIPEQFSGQLDQSETDIASGLQFASSLIPGGKGGRIVLLTDGNHTTGDALSAARLLKNRNLEIDYVPLKHVSLMDAAVTSLKVPPSLYEGEETSVSVTVSSNTAVNATIRLSVNDKDILRQKVNVKEGDNVFTFTHKAAEPGLAVYKAELVNAGDAHIENNSLHAVSTVKGTPRVLVVEGNTESPLPGILKGSGLVVDLLAPEKLPTALGGYLRYESIVFNNVSGHRVTEGQMELIEKAVREFGTGFVMTGGEDSFGLGGYFKTPIEKLLPVDMDIKGKNEMPSLGLVIVIDRSGSMSGNKFTLAKEAAARSVELLREEDTLGFIAFDDRPWVIVETAPMKNKKEVIKKIRSVSVGGGTNIYPSLEKAYEELRELKLQRKHIILLTDGQSATGGDYEKLIEDGKAKNITLSTVALGSDADRALLEDLAEMGSGRFYDVADASVIPSVLSRETVMTTRTYIEDNPFYPIIAPYPEWSSRFSKGVPQMNAYIAVTPKDRARVPVSSAKDDPVLAQWQYGLGSTLAFTSDVSGKWSGDWARWEGWPGFVNQLITASLPQFDSEPFSISVGKEEGNTVVSLASSSKDPLPIEAAVLSQKGEQIDANTKLVSPGKYQLVYPGKPGMYYLSTRQMQKNGVMKVYRTGFSVPYSEEFLLKGTNKEFLKELVSGNGGRELTDPKEAFRPLKYKPEDKQPISEYLLLVAFLVLVLEIFIRRLGISVFGRLLPKRKLQAESDLPSGGEAVFGRLAGAKERAERNRLAKAVELNAAENAKVVPKRKEPLTGVSTGKRDKVTVEQKHAVPKELTAEEKQDRMQRLLEAKKRRT
ncbi:VWA domain-containing protein [Neobacillus notoginsengisoli]|nr:VWA domain-containing protein [Neobacillus notoginsengisoli]